MLRFIGFVFLLFSSSAFALSVSSENFDNNDETPIDFTCDGRDISPQLVWQDYPADTKAFAVVVSDPDAPGGTWYHWVVVNIPVSINEFEMNVAMNMEKGIVLKNSWDNTKYQGPCPPDGTHNYIFDVYALKENLSVNPAMKPQEVEAAIKAATIATSSLSTTYSKK